MYMLSSLYTWQDELWVKYNKQGLSIVIEVTSCARLAMPTERVQNGVRCEAKCYIPFSLWYSIPTKQDLYINTVHFHYVL